MYCGEREGEHCRNAGKLEHASVHRSEPTREGGKAYSLSGPTFNSGARCITHLNRYRHQVENGCPVLIVICLGEEMHIRHLPEKEMINLFRNFKFYNISR